MKALILSINLLIGLISNLNWINRFGDVNKKSKVNLSHQALIPEIKSDPIINDEFISSVLDNDITYKKIINLYHPGKTSKEIVKNFHRPNQSDIIEKFSANGDSFAFYKAKEKVLLLKMNIVSNKLILDKNVMIGADKDLLRRKFKSSFTSDNIIVQDLEGGNTFIFSFKNNRLVKISYQGDID